MAGSQVAKNKVVPVIGMLGNEDMLEDYFIRISTYNKRAQKVLNVFSFADGVIKGGNPFADVELASRYLVSPYELEMAIEEDSEVFKEVYKHIGLVLRSEGDDVQDNYYVARHLADQVEKRLGRPPTPERPVRVSLRGLKVQEDSNSGYGLVFLLGEDSEVIVVPEFDYINDGKCFDKTDERGVPIFKENGDRQFKTRKIGLSPLFVGSFLYLRCDSERLDEIDGMDDERARVVVSLDYV